MWLEQVGAHVILDCSEKRNLQTVRTVEERRTRTITLGDLLFLFLAHFMRIVELLKKLVRVFYAIDAKIHIIDVSVIGPQTSRFGWRIRSICRQRKVGGGARDGRALLSFRLRRWLCRARANNVEAKD